jgi:AraC family transcriptional regulator of adaptative response/methylated-DNA-[protein]-cysteine methyltransferase
LKTLETPPLLPPQAEMERAFAARDPGYDGVFFTAVRTTGIFCRPSCPSRPKLENVEFLPSIKACLFAGYRPCKRCRPEAVDGTLPPWVAELTRRIEAAPETRWTSEELASMGVSPERARRWFQAHYGMTFAAWCRAHRLGTAFTQLREGGTVDDATFEAGFESHSGFRDAFQRVFGAPPGKAVATTERIVVTLLESPLGPLLAAARDGGVCLLEYTDRRMLEHNLGEMRRRFEEPVVPGSHPHLDALRRQLAEYFDGGRRVFEVPLEPRGTAFQERVWAQLQRIPHGTTVSYDELAAGIDQPTAQRAVARANGANRICILIPCHRVIGKDGTLTGYGGGLWRKRLLIELERTGTLPGGTRVGDG